MFRGLLLILDPGASWYRIARAQRGFLWILFVHFLPLLLLTVAAECYMMHLWGVGRGVTGRMLEVSDTTLLAYGISQIVLNLVALLVAAKALQKISLNFHGSNTYAETFRLLAYAWSPVLYGRILDGFPQINTWICLAAGVFFLMAVLYQGIPRVLHPEPTGALGLYLVTALVVAAIASVAHYFCVMLLEGQIEWRTWFA